MPRARATDDGNSERSMGGSDSESSGSSSDEDDGGKVDAQKRRSVKYQKPERSEGRIGHHFAIYHTDSSGTKHRDSFLHRALRNGKFKIRIEPRLANSGAAEDTARIVARDDAEGAAEGTSFWATVYEWACVECAIKVLFDGSEEATMIDQWRDSVHNASSSCHFTAPSPLVVLTLSKLYTCRDSDTILGFRCYAGGLSTLNNMLRAFDSVCRTVGCTARPTQDPLVRTAKRAVEMANDPEGAASFDFATELEPMVEAAINMKGWNYSKKVMSCTQLIVACAIMARVSDVSKFSPRREHLKFPRRRDGNHDDDGVPKWLSIGVWQAKGKRKKHKMRHLRLWRNKLNWKLCPVFWLQLWLRVSGIKKGPLFVQQARGTARAAVFHHYEDEKGFQQAFDKKGKNITVQTSAWRTVLKTIWRVLKMEDLIPHSLRKSSIKWAARCHAQDWEIRNNSGHSETSSSWLGYIEDGMIESDEATQGPNGTIILDPLFSVWTWRAVTFSQRRRGRVRPR